MRYHRDYDSSRLTTAAMLSAKATDEKSSRGFHRLLLDAKQEGRHPSPRANKLNVPPSASKVAVIVTWRRITFLDVCSALRAACHQVSDAARPPSVSQR